MLTVLSIVGAFLGISRAAAVFNSLALSVFWCLLAAIFVVGLFAFKRLMNSPGLLGVHLGSLLILGGAMYGSNTGHDLAKKWLHSRKIPSGKMKIYEGHSGNVVLSDDGRRQLGTLRFTIGLKDFWMEHYENPGSWKLCVDTPAAGDSHQQVREVIEWKPDEEVDVSTIAARLKVLEYYPSARPVRAQGAEPMLEVTDASGKKSLVPAKLGQQMPVDDPKGSLRIVEVFSHLLVHQGKAVNVPGSNANPALKMEFEPEEGEKSDLYAYARPFHMHEQEIKLRYILPEIVGAEPDPDSGLPAMKVLLTYEDRQLSEWLIGKKRIESTSISLATLLGSDVQQDAHGHRRPAPHLVLAPPRPEISDYKSHLIVQDEGEITVPKEVIEVNHPLHYGGYHFYQYSYGQDGGQEYTVLSVTSDSGLWAVYVGFVLLCAGMFWLFWVRPAWGYFTRQSKHGD